jgi:hypothetical protein
MYIDGGTNKLFKNQNLKSKSNKLITKTTFLKQISELLKHSIQCLTYFLENSLYYNGVNLLQSKVDYIT